MAQVTVWFDGACPLCIREIALMRRLDRRGAISFIDASREDGASEDASCPIDRADLLAKFHARENGQLLSGAAAFAAMWRAILVLRPFGLLARRPWALKALDALYRRFLRVRPKLQKFVGRMAGGRKARQR